MLGLTLLGCAPAAARGAGPRPATDPATLVAQAQAFMDAYANDLRTGARERIADRYDPRGAWLVGEGRKELHPASAIRARYLSQWSPPASFEWRDLSYEAVGPDAVMVTGLFLWGVGAERRITCSYTALLLRQENLLRIRLEDESCAPAPPAPAP
ncbi:MAG TPA: hypothetical protein VM890_03430 [Longimicrobium sp.]|nr:hypothetical protein [Longimicrobium sp.]